MQVWKPGTPGWILWAVPLLYCMWQPAIIVHAIHNCFSGRFLYSVYTFDLLWTWNSIIWIFQWLYSLQVWKPGWILRAELLLYCVWQPTIIIYAIHNCFWGRFLYSVYTFDIIEETPSEGVSSTMFFTSNVKNIYLQIWICPIRIAKRFSHPMTKIIKSKQI